MTTLQYLKAIDAKLDKVLARLNQKSTREIVEEPPATATEIVNPPRDEHLPLTRPSDLRD